MTTEQTDQQAREEADSKADTWAAFIIIMLAVVAVSMYVYQPG